MDRTGFQPPRAAMGSAAYSVAYLDRAETPAVRRPHAPLHNVAAAIVVVGIALGVVRIAVVVAIIIGVVEAVPNSRGKCS
jgi:hypothetical protein